MTTTQADLRHVLDISNAGKLTEATRKELEHYAAVICHASIGMHGSPVQLTQIGDTIRLMLLVRISEESQNNALQISKTALYISIAALVAGTIQAVASVIAVIQPTPQVLQAPTQPASQLLAPKK